MESLLISERCGGEKKVHLKKPYCESNKLEREVSLDPSIDVTCFS